MKTTFTMAAAAVVALGAANAASARDQIRIVGSSTVFPYSQAVAEEFANATGARAPVVESTGTGGGFRAFCGGIGEAHPDITGASRPMRASEYQLCAGNGVTDISELKFGFDGLSIAISRNNPTAWNLTKEQIFLALAAQVPVDGRMVPNPYRRWSDIDALLPETAITVFGPPPGSGTRDAFVELAMNEGCRTLPFVEQNNFDDDWIEENCSQMRTDGPYIEAGENDNLIVQRLVADRNAMGIFGYSFLFENKDRLKAVKVNGVEPTFDTIASFEYTIARPLFIYVKNAHREVIPGMADFVELFVSEETIGRGGMLSDRGMVPLPDAMRAQVREVALAGDHMTAPTN